MSNIEWLTMLALGEAVLLLAAALLGLLAWLLHRRRRDADAGAALLEKLRARRLEREDSVQRALVSAGASKEQAESAGQGLAAAEAALGEKMTRVYVERNAAELTTLDESVKALIDDCLKLASSGNGGEDDANSTGPDRTPEVERLRQAVRNLSEELALYRETLNRVFSEYTAPFGVKLDARQQLTATEILDRLESGELAGVAEPESEEGTPPTS